MTTRVVFETHATTEDNEAGIATGWLDGRLSAAGRDQPAHLDVPYPGGESWRDAVRRVAGFLDEVPTRWPGGRVLLVGHVATRLALDHIVLGVRLSACWPRSSSGSLAGSTRFDRYRDTVTDAPRRLLLVNGPNLNLLGTREPDIYGAITLADIEALVASTAADLGLEVRAVQSNHEGVVLDAIHEARHDCAGIVINPGAWTHTSVAVRDALTAVALPVVEVHLSNVHRREPFRHHSYVSDVAEVVVAGAGIDGYAFAVQQLARILG